MKKNKIFVGKIEKNISHNQRVYDINGENNNIINIEKNSSQNKKISDSLSVKEKINELLNRNGYVFNVDVKIITYNKEYNTRIAGKVNNHLITLDNDIINISDIKDIVIKD